MVNEGIKEIIELNNKFYEAHNESFDKSRNFGYWEGFEEALKYLPQNPDILDLGCGNARFLRFLQEKNYQIKNYLGLDTSREFLEKNKINFPQYNFSQLDVIANPEAIKTKHPLIVAFGLTHHIPDSSFRSAWFQKISQLLTPEGILILSFWNFETSKSDQNFKTQSYQIEKNDYFLGWKEDFKFHRYCHFYDVDEIAEIPKINSELEILAKFQKDQNTYLILKAK